MEWHEMESRFAAMAARVGALELLVETLLAERMSASVAFDERLEEEYANDKLTDGLSEISDGDMRDRVALIGANLSERLAGARRQCASFGRKSGRHA